MRTIPGTPIPTLVFEDRAELVRVLADEIEALVRRPVVTVIGLATGSTPLDVYRELVRRRRETGLSFARTTTFNLDEYVGLSSSHPQSFRRWTHEHLFQHADFAHTCFPDVEARDLGAAARAFEHAIEAAGGIDLQILGIGRNGHVAFNEPGATRDSRTRVVELHPWTRADAAPGFGGLEHVPLRAVTMGIQTILAARRLRVLALGTRKAAIVRETLRAAEGPNVPSTFLRAHPDVRLLLDGEAAALL